MVLDGIRGWFKRGGDREERSLMKQTAIHGATVRQMSEQQLIHEQGINREMIKDDDVTQTIDMLTYTDFVKEQDATGKETGRMVPTNMDLNMMGAKLKMSTLIRTSYMEDIDADIGQLGAEIAVIRQVIGMDEDRYELGMYTVIDGLRDIYNTAWGDSKRGRKAKLLKARTSSVEVSMPDQKTIRSRDY